MYDSTSIGKDYNDSYSDVQQGKSVQNTAFVNNHYAGTEALRGISNYFNPVGHCEGARSCCSRLSGCLQNASASFRRPSCNVRSATFRVAQCCASADCATLRCASGSTAKVACSRDRRLESAPFITWRFEQCKAVSLVSEVLQFVSVHIVFGSVIVSTGDMRMGISILLAERKAILFARTSLNNFM